MTAQIQIQFPAPGQWDKMDMTAVYRDAEGYTRTDAYTQDDIPADQAPALASVVAALVGLSEPWQAAQVWARRADFYAPEIDEPLKFIEAVGLTVEAVNAQGGRKMFTHYDCPAFILSAPSAVAFFKYFTAS